MTLIVSLTTSSAVTVRMSSVPLKATAAATATVFVVTMILARRTIHPAVFFVNERLLFALISAGNDATVHAHLNQVFWLFGNFLHLAQESRQQLDTDRLIGLDLVDSLFNFSDFSLIFFGDFVSLNIVVATQDDALKH